MATRFYQGADLLLPSSFFFSSPSPTSRSQWALPDVIASSRSQWVLPDPNRETRSAVDTAGPQLRAPELSGHCRTPTASAISQSDRMPDRMSDDVSDRMSENISGRICRMAKYMSDRMPDRMRDRIANRISEHIYIYFNIYIYMSYHNISFQMTIQWQNLCLGVGITRSKVVFFTSAAWSRLRSKTAFDVLNIVHLIFVAHAWRAWIPSIHQVPWSGASFYWFLPLILMDSLAPDMFKHLSTDLPISKQII